MRIHGEAPGIHVDKLRSLLTERYTPGIWEGREIYLRRKTQDWVVIENMNPGPLTDVIECDGAIDGFRYHVYGGLIAACRSATAR